MTEDNKNDYKLINLLLEDGSETSILKLKMIVDLADENFDFLNIKKSNHILFVKLFEDYAYKEFDKYIYLYLKKTSNNAIIYMIENFPDLFVKKLNEDNGLINYFVDKKVKIKLKKLLPLITTLG